jgi:ankyrin repeat protein
MENKNEMRNNEGSTPLHYACEKKSKEMMLMLLMAGFDPTIKNNAN